MDTDNYIQNHSCVSKDNECNIIRPLSNMEFYLTNPSTRKVYTSEEKKDKLDQYTNICWMNNGRLGKCCDPNNTDLNKYKELIPKELREKYKKVKTEYVKNNQKQLKVCPEGEKCPGYREPTAYEYCKLSDAKIDKDNIVYSNTPDCYTANCNRLETPFIITQSDIDNSSEHIEDSEIVRFIKDNHLSGLQELVHNKKRKINKVLTYGFPGNTLVHEAIYRKSLDCIYYLLESVDKSTLEIKNQDGNTPLHIACLKGMKDVVNMLINLGVNVHTKNKYGDTPLMSAIRAGDEEVVRYLLVIGGGLFDKNEKGENPLFVAVTTINKNLNLIRILCDNGADILERNNKGESMLTVLKQEETTLKNQEIETYLVNKVFLYFQHNQDYYKKVVILNYPEFSPFEIHDKAADKIKASDYENIELTMDATLDDSELYKEKNQEPEKLLPASAKKFVEHFEVNSENLLKNNRTMYILVFLIIVLVMAFLVNNY